MKGVLHIKSKEFALSIIRLYSELTEKKEYIMSKQLLRSGTSIGANIAESEFAQSKPDFIVKRSIALKEVAETIYWLELLHDSEFISSENYALLLTQSQSILKMLTSGLKTLKNNI